jgi:magnesium-transporting ATPase (P-type)
MPEFLNIELMNWEDFWDLVLRVVFNGIVVLYIVRGLYYRITPRKDYLFTFVMISQMIFFIVMLLENVNVNMGFALGLFAIFAMLRWRTRQIPTREMTYLFVVIGISTINGLANRRVSYAELLLTNVIVIGLVYVLEKIFLLKNELSKQVIYENVELIKPERREELIKDLQERTGIKINRVEIGRIDYLRDTVRLRIFYYQDDNVPYSAEDDSDGMDDDDD